MLISGDPTAQTYTLTQAKVLAKLAIDVMCDLDLAKDMKRNFKRDLSVRQS